MLLVFLAGFTDIVLVTLGTAPIEGEVTESEHRLVTVVQRSTSPEEQARTAALLSSSLTIRVPRQLKTRHLTISGVEFYSEEGTLLGSSNVSQVMGSWESMQLPGLELVQELTDSVPDPSSIPLSPMSDTLISLRATIQEDLGAQSESPIYAEIEATSGSLQFSWRSDAAEPVADEALES